MTLAQALANDCHHRNRLLSQLRQLIFEAENHISDLQRQIEQHETKAANVLLSRWELVAQVWREAKAEVEDGRP